MALPDRRIAVERWYTPQPEPYYPRGLIHVAPHTHAWRNPHRVRQRRGRGRFVHLKWAFFMFQRRLGRVEKRIDEHLRHLRPICIRQPPHVKRHAHLLLLHILALHVLLFVLRGGSSG